MRHKNQKVGGKKREELLIRIDDLKQKIGSGDHDPELESQLMWLQRHYDYLTGKSS